MRIFLTLLIIVFFNGCDDASKSLKSKYISDLNNWINNGGSINSIQEEVQEPCNQLMMLMATKQESDNFLKCQDMDEYDFRVNFCMAAVINNVHSQPEFEQDMHIAVCEEKIPFLRRICKEFVR